MTVTDMILMSPIAAGVDIETRWTGPFPPAVKRLLRAYQALETERMGQRLPFSKRSWLWRERQAWKSTAAIEQVSVGRTEATGIFNDYPQVMADAEKRQEDEE